jgi:hypothetical protein
LKIHHLATLGNANRDARWYIYFQKEKSQFKQILKWLAIEDAGILYGPLVKFPAIWYTYYMAIWYIL